jgi:hypothetical protein
MYLVRVKDLNMSIYTGLNLVSWISLPELSQDSLCEFTPLS